MTSEAEGRDETTTEEAAAVTPGVTAEETNTAAVEAARTDAAAKTADIGAETAAGGAAMSDADTATATTSAPSAPATTPAATLAAEAATPAAEAAASSVESSPLSPPLSSPPLSSPESSLSSPQDGARIRHSLETIKTAVVWLIVIQILTILSPLLRVSLKWMILVGLILTLGSFAVGAVAYLKAQRAQSGLPE